MGKMNVPACGKNSKKVTTVASKVTCDECKKSARYARLIREGK